MGSKSSKPLSEYSPGEIAECVSSYGGKFLQYAERIRANGLDGDFLASLSEQELHETLDELGVESRLHRRKFLSEFKGSLPGLLDASSSSNSSITKSCSTSDKAIANALKTQMDAQSRENHSLHHSLKVLEKDGRNWAVGPPEGTATIVLTDVEASTNLWESNERAMKGAIALHDEILRKLCAKYRGYEIDTEGDAFFLAFKGALDAYAFALNFQTALSEAPWSPEILSLPQSHQGLRVKVAVHQGPVKTRKNAVTGRTEYVGSAMDIARSLEDEMTRGGHILTTSETWNSVFHLSESHLQSPQVTDLGNFRLGKKKWGEHEAPPKRILDIAPVSFPVRGRGDKNRLSSQSTLRQGMPSSSMARVTTTALRSSVGASR